MPKEGILRNVERKPKFNKKFGNKQEVNSIVQHAFGYIILTENENENENKNLSVKYETHVNIDDEVEEYDMNGLDKLSLDEKKWRKREFQNKLKYIYDINILNGTNHIHDNKVNNIAKWNLLHDILNPYKHSKI